MKRDATSPLARFCLKAKAVLAAIILRSYWPRAAFRTKSNSAAGSLVSIAPESSVTNSAPLARRSTSRPSRSGVERDRRSSFQTTTFVPFRTAASIACPMIAPGTSKPSAMVRRDTTGVHCDA